ncbi:hypothetical protein [Herbaspirillum sp. RV1423]|uniref:hypothetical protein n=1 Tax=Herbaspirillum sp. RV1423 TaxID=1443993 RepID=UPI0012DE28DE|nr:hypothetical protein [Herbaspirillum sp. RV1423]
MNRLDFTTRLHTDATRPPVKAAPARRREVLLVLRCDFYRLLNSGFVGHGLVAYRLCAGMKDALKNGGGVDADLPSALFTWFYSHFYLLYFFVESYMFHR